MSFLDRLKGLRIEPSNELQPGEPGWEPVTGGDAIHLGILGPNPDYSRFIEGGPDESLVRYEALQAAGDKRSYWQFLLDEYDDEEGTDG